jgi:acyl-coenzyme A synthetase/AMP-(fatty) acid ligase
MMIWRSWWQVFTGDGCLREEDVLNISGHRLGTAKIESVPASRHLILEAADVGYPHSLKGQRIYCYVSLMAREEGNQVGKHRSASTSRTANFSIRAELIGNFGLHPATAEAVP